jgi:hypothetical protein
MAPPPKPFGQRGVKPPPIVTHAPQGLPGGPEPHSPLQMRTLAISLGTVGATALGLFAMTQALRSLDNRQICAQQDGSNPGAAPCRSSSSHGGGGHGGFWGSSGSSSASHSSASFGGFGAAGGGHGGGGGE